MITNRIAALRQAQGDHAPRLLTLYFLLLTITTYGQNFDDLEDPITVTGNASFNSTGYWSNADYRRDPLQWFAIGNLTFDLLDVKLPFTYRLTNTSSELTEYPQMVALHPTYKWVTGHVGVTSMTFSKYTLNGHQFAGGGLELTPGNWSFRSMAGNLGRDRFGYGSEIGYRIGKLGVKGIYFAASDDTSQNAVGSLQFATPLGKKLVLEGEAARSDEDWAYNGAVRYKLKRGRVGVSFEHIDPGYESMGTYFFNNDLENITVDQHWNLLSGKLNFNSRIGFRRNNLDNLRIGTTERWIGNLAMNAMISKSIIAMATYSNFSTFTRNRPSTDPFYYAPGDTMEVYQVTQNGQAMINFNYGTDSIRHSTRLMTNYQVTIVNGQPMEVFSANAAHTIQSARSKSSISLIANLNRSVTPIGIIDYYGPSVQLSKKWGKTSVGVTSTVNRRVMNGELGLGSSESGMMKGEVWSHGLSVNQTRQNKRISFRLNILQRNLDQRSLEINGSINLSYTLRTTNSELRTTESTSHLHS